MKEANDMNLPITAPDFWAQTAEPMTDEERHAWIRHACMEAKDQGCIEVRAAMDDADNPKIVLVEGWKIRVHEWPEPSFHFTADP